MSIQIAGMTFDRVRYAARATCSISTTATRRPAVDFAASSEEHALRLDEHGDLAGG